MRWIIVPVHPLPVERASEGVPPRPQGADARSNDPLSHWVAVARASIDACLVVDAGGNIAAVSPTAAELLGTPQETFVGRPLDEAICLVDFTDNALEAQGVQRRIPPLIAVRENALSRGMIRIRRADGLRLMLDAVAAPIHDGERRAVGAVSFLASV